MLLLFIIELIRKHGSGTPAADKAIEQHRKKLDTLNEAGYHAISRFDKSLAYGIESGLILGNAGEPYTITLLGVCFAQRLLGLNKEVKQITKKIKKTMRGNVSSLVSD